MKQKERLLGIVVLLEVIFLAIVLVLGILLGRFGLIKKTAQQGESETVTAEAEGIDPMATTASEDELPGQTTEISEAVRAFADAMSTEQKVAQLILTRPETLTGVPIVDEAGSITETALQQYPIAGLVYSAKNYSDDTQFETLLARTNTMYSASVATNLLFMGIHNDGQSDRMVAQTSFSISSLDRVFSTTDISQIDMTGLALVYDSDDADSSDGKYLLAADVATVESLTEGDFTGIIIGTDESTAVNLIVAGCDMIYVTENVTTTYDAILSAVNEGTISQDRLRDAVCNILSAKEGLADTGLDPIVTNVAEETEPEEQALQQTTQTLVNQAQPTNQDQGANVEEAAVNDQAVEGEIAAEEQQAADTVATTQEANN